MQARLQSKKLAELIGLLESSKVKKLCSIHELDSWIEKLQHASAVIRPGRSFLRRMILLSKRVANPNKLLRLNMALRCDLAWWSLFTCRWNGISHVGLGPGGTNWDGDIGCIMGVEIWSIFGSQLVPTTIEL